MPEPVSRYQGPLSLSMSMPAAFHRSQLGDVRAALVAARDERRLRRLDLAAAPRRCPCRRATFAGSDFGPIRTKSLYITSKRFTPKPSARNFSSAGLSCTNTHVGVAAAGPCRAPGRCRPRRRAPRCRSSSRRRQQVLEQARLLGRGRRGDGDELLRLLRRDSAKRTASNRRARIARASGPWQFSFDEGGRLGRGGSAERTSRRARARRGGPGGGTGPRRPGAAPGRGCGWS